MNNLTVAAAMTVFLAAPALAENLLASDPQSIAEVMQSEGYVAKLTKDDVGDPKIESRISDTTFSIYFYGCTNNIDCSSIQLSAGYDLDTPFSTEKTNAWMNQNRYARAFLDEEGDPYLRVDVQMYGDGVGVQSFIETLDLWRRLVEDFEVVIGW